jgi:hypothetical protein
MLSKKNSLMNRKRKKLELKPYRVDKLYIPLNSDVIIAMIPIING